MKWRSWLEILFPTLIVGLVWVVLSSVTTIYISWLDHNQQEIIDQNLAAVRSSADMGQALCGLQSTPLSGPQVAAASDEAEVEPAEVDRAVVKQAGGGGPDLEAHSAAVVLSAPTEKRLIQNFHDALVRARSVSLTIPERDVLRRIGEEFERYKNERIRAKLLAPDVEWPTNAASQLANQIAGLCAQLCFLNEGIIQQERIDNRRWNSRVLVARLLTILFGLPLGLYLGIRVARRLRRRLTAIHVTLEGVAGDVGAVLVDPRAVDGNLDSIDRQVRAVASRLQLALTELEGARREAIRNERLAAVGQLAAGVAHELRNPLTAVKLLVQMAVHRGAGDGARFEHLAVVQDEIARMEGTIQGLLDFARPSASRRLRCNLWTTLRRAVTLASGRAGQQGIQIDLPENQEPVWVTCDPEQIHQVFVNLLLNGIDAMPDGGRLRVESGRTPATADSPATCDIVLLDQGPGIPPDVLDHIFEPFMTTKSRGTGLGLAISRRLVEDHGGKLTASNRPENEPGAMFTVSLPCECSDEQRGEVKVDEITQVPLGAA